MSQEFSNEKGRSVGKVYNKVSKNGLSYMKFVIGGKWYVAFPNTRKENEKSHDFTIYESETRKPGETPTARPGTIQPTFAESWQHQKKENNPF